MTQTTAGYDYPEQTYYPRWRIKLTIRFGEFGQTAQLVQLVPSKPTRSLAGVAPARNSLQAVPDPNHPGQYVLQPQGGGSQPSGTAQDQTSSSDDLTQALAGIVPQEFHWSQNGVRTGDTFSCVIRFADCPIDPRTVRSIAIEFYLGTVTAAVAGAQVTGARGGTPAASGGGNVGAEPLDLIPDTYTDSNGNPRTNLRFSGWVDKFKVGWSSGRPVIQLECTDNSRQLSRIQAPAKMQISTVKPIDQAIADYLAAFPSLEGLAVQYRPTGQTPPTIGSICTAASIHQGTKGRPVSKNAGPEGSEKVSVWDYLTDEVRALGHALYVDGTTVVVTRVRSITSSAIEARADDPYVPRVLANGQTLKNRTMIYGRNVSALDIERDFNVHPPCNVSVRAYDTEKKQVLVERFPLQADMQVYAIPGNATPDQKWLEYQIGGGIKDRPTMRAFAQEIYENLGRQEIAVSVRTKNFASFGGGNEDPDLLDLKFGDALDVLFSREDFYSTLNQLQQDLDSVALNSQYLQDAGFPPAFADRYAQTYTNAGLTYSFRTHKVEIAGSVDQGVSFDLRCVNYVEVTSDKSLAPGEEPPSNPPAQPPATPNLGPPAAGPAP